MLNPSPERERGREGGREGEGEREREVLGTYTHMQTCTHASSCAHTMHMYTYCVYTYYYVLYTHPKRDQCYNESRQSVPDASSGPGQSIHGCRERG